MADDDTSISIKTITQPQTLSTINNNNNKSPIDGNNPKQLSGEYSSGGVGDRTERKQNRDLTKFIQPILIGGDCNLKMNKSLSKKGADKSVLSEIGGKMVQMGTKRSDPLDLQEDLRKKRCTDRYDSSESSDSGVATLSCTDSSTTSSDASDPGSPYSPSSCDDHNQTTVQSVPTTAPKITISVPTQIQIQQPRITLPLLPTTITGQHVAQWPWMVGTSTTAATTTVSLSQSHMAGSGAIQPITPVGGNKMKRIMTGDGSVTMKRIRPATDKPISAVSGVKKSGGNAGNHTTGKSPMILVDETTSTSPQTKITGFFKSQMKSVNNVKRDLTNYLTATTAVTTAAATKSSVSTNFFGVLAKSKESTTKRTVDMDGRMVSAVTPLSQPSKPVERKTAKIAPLVPIGRGKSTATKNKQQLTGTRQPVNIAPRITPNLKRAIPPLIPKQSEPPKLTSIAQQSSGTNQPTVTVLAVRLPQSAGTVTPIQPAQPKTPTKLGSMYHLGPAVLPKLVQIPAIHQLTGTAVTTTSPLKDQSICVPSSANQNFLVNSTRQFTRLHPNIAACPETNTHFILNQGGDVNGGATMATMTMAANGQLARVYHPNDAHCPAAGTPHHHYVMNQSGGKDGGTRLSNECPSIGQQAANHYIVNGAVIKLQPMGGGQQTVTTQSSQLGSVPIPFTSKALPMQQTQSQQTQQYPVAQHPYATQPLFMATSTGLLLSTTGLPTVITSQYSGIQAIGNAQTVAAPMSTLHSYQAAQSQPNTTANLLPSISTILHAHHATAFVSNAQTVTSYPNAHFSSTTNNILHSGPLLSPPPPTMACPALSPLLPSHNSNIPPIIGTSSPIQFISPPPIIQPNSFSMANQMPPLVQSVPTVPTTAITTACISPKETVVTARPVATVPANNSATTTICRSLSGGTTGTVVSKSIPTTIPYPPSSPTSSTPPPLVRSSMIGCSIVPPLAVHLSPTIDDVVLPELTKITTLNIDIALPTERPTITPTTGTVSTDIEESIGYVSPIKRSTLPSPTIRLNSTLIDLDETSTTDIDLSGVKSIFDSLLLTTSISSTIADSLSITVDESSDPITEQQSPNLFSNYKPIMDPSVCARSPILSQPKTIRFPAQGMSSGIRKSDGRLVGVCYWDDCAAKYDTSSALLDHLQSQHVNSQTGPFTCQWDGCKVHGKESCSRRWLERHVLSHGGTKTYKCIVDGCGLRFATQSALEKHVNNHFTTTETKDATQRRSMEPIVPKKLRVTGKKLRYRRQPYSARMFDFFDARMMEGVQHRMAITETVLNGPRESIQFKGRPIARRVTKNGTVEVHIRWSPVDIIPDEWITESRAQLTKTIPIKALTIEQRTTFDDRLTLLYKSPNTTTAIDDFFESSSSGIGSSGSSSSASSTASTISDCSGCSTPTEFHRVSGVARRKNYRKPVGRIS